MFRSLRAGGRVLAVAAVGAIAAGALLGQPVLVSFVETGSMAPTLAAGDGFVAVPAVLAGDVSTGDVVVFESETVGGGGLTTHRVVAETDRGYVTKGDANPFTDQDSGEPIVREGQIVATALTVNGEVLALPGLGTAVEGVRAAVGGVYRRVAVALGLPAAGGVRGPAFALLALSVLVYVADVVANGRKPHARRRDPDRDDGRSGRLLAVGFAGLVVVAATAAMVAPAGTHQYRIVSSEFSSGDPTVVERGGSADLPYAVPNTGILPVYAYLEPASAGVDVPDAPLRVGARGEVTATITVDAPAETGYYPTYVREHRYLAVLPGPAIDALYGVHPWAPIAAIDALLGASAYALARRFLGGGRVRTVSREPRGRGSRRALRRLYD